MYGPLRCLVLAVVNVINSLAYNILNYFDSQEFTKHISEYIWVTDKLPNYFKNIFRQRKAKNTNTTFNCMPIYSNVCAFQ